MKTKYRSWLFYVLALVAAGPLRALPPIEYPNATQSCTNRCCACEATGREGYYGYDCVPLQNFGAGLHYGGMNCQAYALPIEQQGPVGCSTSGASCSGYHLMSDRSDIADYDRMALAIEQFMFRWRVVPQADLMDFVAKLDHDNPMPEQRYEALRALWNRTVSYWQLKPGETPFRPEPRQARATQRAEVDAAPSPARHVGPVE